MRFRFQFRRYRLPFRSPVRTAHGIWSEREGVIVRLEEVADGKTGVVGFGEAAPIPWFGTETVEQVEETCRAIGEWVEERLLDAVPTEAGCVRNALAAARAEIERKQAEVSEVPEAASKGEDARYLGVAALLPAGKAALPLIEPKSEIGYRVFKWKVGVGGVADELAILDDLCAELPSGAKLRLDANGAWDRRRAERWLERCSDRPIEFVEQPCYAADALGQAQRQRTEDLMLGLAEDYPTPLALDESLVGEDDVERWIGAGWPGVFVVKPSLFADVSRTMGRLEKARAKVVFSSALETAVGAAAALRVAFAWKGEARALGFGVWPLFADARFDGPAAAPFVRRNDVARLDAEAVWTALS